jgi:hypothetical protein
MGETSIEFDINSSNGTLREGQIKLSRFSFIVT